MAWLSLEMIELQSGRERFPRAALQRLQAQFGNWPFADWLDGPVTVVA